MSFWFQSGEGLNLLARAAAVKAPTPSPAEDSGYPVSHLYDGLPSQYFKHSAAQTSSSVTFDLNLVENGDGESATIPPAWTVSGTNAALSQIIGSAYSGSGSLRLQGDGAISAQYERRLRAGEKARLYYALYSACLHSFSLQLKNLETGKYLDSAGAWQTSSATVVAAQAAAAWASGYVDLVMPDVEEGGGFWQRVQLIIGSSDATASHDFRFEVKLVPGWDAVAWFGHVGRPVTCRPGIEYQALTGNDPGDSFVSGSSAGFDWLKTTPSAPDPFPDEELHQPALWNRLQTVRYERWVRFYLTRAVAIGIPAAAGEIVLCQLEVLPRKPVLSLGDEHRVPGQIRHDTGAGDVWVYNRTPHRRPRTTLRFETFSNLATGVDVDFRALARIFEDRTHGGRHPVLLLPYEHERRLVVYGTVADTFAWSHDPPRRSLEVDVVAFPVPDLHPQTHEA